MMPGSRRILFLLAVVAIAGSACASSGPQGEQDYRYDRYEISQAEIAAHAEDVSNLYQLVARLRPHWLETTSRMGSDAEIVVFDEQSLLGNAESLGNLAADYPHSMEFLDRSQATAQLSGIGSRRIGGAIVIHRQ